MRCPFVLTVLINESGLYSLILASKKPQAKQFKRWVTKDVLPSIRKVGTYAINSEEQNTKIQAQIEENARKNRELDIRIIESMLKHFPTDATCLMTARSWYINNATPSTSNFSTEKALTDGQECFYEMTQLVRDAGFGIRNFKELGKIGSFVARKYKKKFGKTPSKMMKEVNGLARPVNHYCQREKNNVETWIKEYFAR